MTRSDNAAVPDPRYDQTEADLPENNNYAHYSTSLDLRPAIHQCNSSVGVPTLLWKST